MNYYAIIPARGDSKRLPGKNITKISNRPLIDYTLSAAVKSKKLSGILVSTDNQLIAEHVRSVGGPVPFFRPKELAQDSSPVIDVIKHALDFLENNGENIDAIVLLQPTSPFRTAHHIDEAIKLFASSAADTLTAVCQASEHPYWCWTMKNDEFQPYYTKQHMTMERENLPPAFIENGAIFIIKREFIKKGTIYGEKIVPYIMDAYSSVDIDTEEDLHYAEFLIHQRYVKL